VKKRGQLKGLLERGFDKSTKLPFATSAHVGCSQCEALVINGVPCHEHGCPNKPPVCRECGGLGHFDCRFGDPDEWEIDARMAEEAR